MSNLGGGHGSASVAINHTLTHIGSSKSSSHRSGPKASQPAGGMPLQVAAAMRASRVPRQLKMRRASASDCCSSVVGPLKLLCATLSSVSFSSVRSTSHWGKRPVN